MFNVMVVDDEPVSHDYIRSLIPWEEAGFYLYPPVYSGEEAKKILESSPVDIVVLDVFMPGENGVILSRFIADHYPRIAVLAVSSHDDYDYVREILKNGAYDYILKHRLDEETLRTALRGLAARIGGSSGKGGENNGGEKEEKRERIHAWLFAGRTCPFPPGGGRIAVSAAKVSLESLPHGSRNIIIPGIIALIEGGLEGEGEITAVFREPGFFITFIRFVDTVSEKKAADILALLDRKNSGTIRLVYHLEYNSRYLPPLGPAAIPGVIRRLLDFFPERPAGGMGIALSVLRRKTLADFLKEKNRAGIEIILREIFSRIEKDDRGARLGIVRDLGEVFRDFAEEQGIPARFTGLVEWAENRSSRECEQKYKQLFRQLMDEIERIPGEDEHIKQTRSFLLDHYGEECGLEETAAALSISPSYLSRLYKKETGVSFVQALNQIRSGAARAYLAEGMNLKSIASLCGFKYYSYFIKVFRDHTGVTPADFVHNGYDKNL